MKAAGVILEGGLGLNDGLQFPEDTAAAFCGGQATRWRVFPRDFCSKGAKARACVHYRGEKLGAVLSVGREARAVRCCRS